MELPNSSLKILFFVMPAPIFSKVCTTIHHPLAASNKAKEPPAMLATIARDRLCRDNASAIAGRTATRPIPSLSALPVLVMLHFRAMACIFRIRRPNELKGFHTINLAKMPDRLTAQVRFEIVDGTVRRLEEVSSRRMFGCEGYFIKGKMFCFEPYKAGFIVKLPIDERTNVLKEPFVTPFNPRSTAKFGEWVRFDLSDSRSTKSVIKILKKSYEYVRNED